MLKSSMSKIVPLLFAAMTDVKKKKYRYYTITIILSTSLFSNTHRFLVNVSVPLRCYDDGGGVALTEGHMSM